MSAEAEKEKNHLFLTGMILSMFCWGISWASGKVLSGYGSAENIAMFRFVITFGSLFAILLLFRQKIVIEWKSLKDLIPAALCISFYTYLFFKGLHAGKAGAGGVLVTTLNPIISYGIMLAYTKKTPRKLEAVGLAVGLLAGAFLLRVWDHPDMIFSSGNGYFVLATIMWAFLSIFTSRSSRYGSPMAFSLWMYGLCGVFMLLLTDMGENVTLFHAGDVYFWGNMIFSATITTALATTFYFVATSKLGASKASSFIFLVPFSAALGSWLFLGEVIETHTVIGGVMGVVAVYLINRK
jgi:drug/metabolite transporter (DMT)-like permease